MIEMQLGQFLVLHESTGEPLSDNQKRAPVLASSGAGGEMGRVKAIDEGCALWMLDWDDELRLIACIEVGEVPDFEQLHTVALEIAPAIHLLNLEPANVEPI